MRATGAVSSLALAIALVAGASSAPAWAGDNVAAIFSDGQDVSPDVLANQRGGTSPSINASAAATVANNTVGSNTVTGSVDIANSFTNASGLFTVFQNSGNNVAMQSQTILNVNLQ